MHIARAVKRIIASTIRHLNQPLLDRLALLQLRWVYEISRAELLAPLVLIIIHIHDDDLRRPVLDAPLDDAESDTARAEDGDITPFLDTVLACRDDGGAVSGRDAASEQTAPVHGRLVRHGNDRDVRHDRVLGEGRGAHEVQQRLALAGEARGSVGHDALALGRADLAAEIGLAGSAEFAGAAFGRAE